jgi:hypothetical protein
MILYRSSSTWVNLNFKIIAYIVNEFQGDANPSGMKQILTI